MSESIHAYEAGHCWHQEAPQRGVCCWCGKTVPYAVVEGHGLHHPLALKQVAPGQ